MINANDILQFFVPKLEEGTLGPIVPKAVGDFYKTIGDRRGINFLTVVDLCKRLEREGLLIYSGQKHGYGPGFCDTYYSFDYKQQGAEYGTYNFLLYGFPQIRTHFTKSVRPVVIKYEDFSTKEYDIGTYFTIQDHVAITARHCLPNRAIIQLRDINNRLIEPIIIVTPKNPDIDLAIIITQSNCFKGLNHFKLNYGNVLDEVITMGYPSIPGFEAIQIADNLVVTAETKSTTGKVVGQERSYLDRQNYFLINARVKGGNSGGPLINRRGEVIGVIAQLPQESDKIDTLGYGIATTSNSLIDFLESFQNDDTEICRLTPTILSNGFRL